MSSVELADGGVLVGCGSEGVLVDRIEQAFVIVDVSITLGFGMSTSLAFSRLSSVFFVPKSTVSISRTRHAKPKPNTTGQKIFA